MQGLYPPVGLLGNTSYPDEPAQMADGTVMNFPLSGYQYPEINIPNTKDPNYIWISGHTNCPLYTSSREDYLLTEEYQRIEVETSSFYTRLYTYLLAGFFSRYGSVYSNALRISEYLNYIYTHETTQQNRPALSDVRRAGALADRLAYTMNGDLSVRGKNGDPIRTVAGRTLARSILSGFERNILTDGEYAKMTLFFGRYEPMMAFYSLVQLASRNRPNFYRIPDFGSSLIFELYSLESNDSASYPSSRSDLMVRFLVRNGTDYSNSPIPYPLFGHGPGVIGVPYSEFEAEMKSIMISSPREWCTVCNSSNVFCPFYESQNRNGLSGVSSECSKGPVSPAIAGLIGAVVTIVFLGLVATAATLFLNYRVFKSGKKRRSEIGFFRGGRKLPSDTNLAVSGYSGAHVNRDGDMSVGTTDAWGSETSVGDPDSTGDSWEMMPQSEHPGHPLRPNGRAMGRTGRKHGEEDDDELQVIAHPKPVTVREHV